MSESRVWINSFFAALESVDCTSSRVFSSYSPEYRNRLESTLVEMIKVGGSDSLSFTVDQMILLLSCLVRRPSSRLGLYTAVTEFKIKDSS